MVLISWIGSYIENFSGLYKVNIPFKNDYETKNNIFSPMIKTLNYFLFGHISYFWNSSEQSEIRKIFVIFGFFTQK